MKEKMPIDTKAFSVVEYIILLVIIISAFIGLKPYIQRGIFGMWAQAGQGFGFGRQYDAQKTIECTYDATFNKWYDRRCFDQYVGNKNPPCGSGDASCENEAVYKCAVEKGSVCMNDASDEPN